jgi:malto-oligosyltrehalose synthase
MSVPRATMRLQFHRAFTFDSAVRIVPYLAALHISHLYASPILTARAGSTHGYDVVDPTQINPELGGEPSFRRLVAALRGAGLGIIVDIVPNHMAVGDENPWWLDVLGLGRRSSYAKYFDIDWEPPDEALCGKILAPVLGRPYGEALAQGDITVVFNTAADRFEARYFDHVFPLDPTHRADIERERLDAFDPATPQGRKRLHKLLERQNFRLAWWRTANDEINWRRFFDINELAALRVEDDEVFEVTHAKLFALFEEGLIDGVRIDHVDGLADPAGYCRKLRRRLAELSRSRPLDLSEPPYIVVEKILGAGEKLAAEWECNGTTGYDFMDQVSAVQHDPAGERRLGDLWHAVSGRAKDFEIEEAAARRELLDRSFAAPLEGLVFALHRLARSDPASRDFSLAAIRRAVIEILAGMRVYRTYARPGHPSRNDAPHLQAALARAQRSGFPGDRHLVAILGRWLSGEKTNAPDLQDIAMRRFQHLCPSLAAKAVEDTALYRFGQLLSRSDVGFDGGRFVDSVADFHQKSRRRLESFPNSLLATATHDHKRGEDVRARLAVLSEIAEEWRAHLGRWTTQAESLANGLWPALSGGDIAILLQMIVGAWPPDLAAEDIAGCAAYCARLAAWQQKALREAKLATDWTAPDEAYESSARRFLEGIFDRASSTLLLGKIATFAHRIAPAGAVNGLAQVLLKLTSPGVPDIYQGTEFWDLSLVDPDNRRDVDFMARMDALSDGADLRELARHWRDGRIKQAVTARCLAWRQEFPDLFGVGEYLPLPLEGSAADRAIVFARRSKNATAITIAPHLAASLLGSAGDIVIPALAWGDTRFRLPACALSSCQNILTGAEIVASDGCVPLRVVLAELPVALMIAPASDARTIRPETFHGVQQGVRMTQTTTMSALGISAFVKGFG